MKPEEQYEEMKMDVNSIVKQYPDCMIIKLLIKILI